MNEELDIKKRFLNSLKLGTGETYLLQKEYPKADFSRQIVKGAVQNFAYDRQSEGSRANYIYGLIKKSKNRQKIEQSILSKLQVKKSDWYGLDHMCDLAVLFHKAGNQYAKEALRSRFEKNGLDEYEFCGQDQLIEIEGLAGLLTVAEVVGKTLLKDQGDWEDSYRVDSFQKKNKGIDVYLELEKTSRNNKYIKAYLTSITQNKWGLPRKRKAKIFSYSLIKERIEADKFRFISEEKANELSDEEVKRLAEDFLREKDKYKQELFLRFFSKIKFPFEYKPILNIAGGTDTRKSRLVEFAVDALKFFGGEDIRKLALQKIAEYKNPSIYFPLLTGTYREGDSSLLNEVANRSRNFDYIHSIVFGIIDIYQANPTKACKAPLETIYSAMNCGLHRYTILKILEENQVLSNKILSEMQFDSYSEIRILYRSIRKTSGNQVDGSTSVSGSVI
ncbi:hypothetical protein MKJ04_14020 [Pontibacter sp. E15-1]|uniref:hypothetical protein n=1 Tax=Pontibacter sp. E15-1 TaxID=2919918 RepID=UPI001F4FB079|nr:hypothetical protein [Pontibacter sp. E15-1]MCJ8165961.1 hypothetical protein [Pontibacter sp. E15-1]